MCNTSKPTPPTPNLAKPTQAQMFYAADRHAADANIAFMYAVNHGMTREDLASCIELRPALWSRFSNWLDKLPSRDTIPVCN